MKQLALVLAIATVGVLLAGFSGHRGEDAPIAVPGAMVPLVDAGTLPEGHPPLNWRHPPLPEGHPPLTGADLACPYGELRQEPAPSSEPGPRAEDAPIIST